MVRFSFSGRCGSQVNRAARLLARRAADRGRLFPVGVPHQLSAPAGDEDQRDTVTKASVALLTGIAPSDIDRLRGLEG